MQTAMWITIALLTPLWWGVGLMLLALLGDLWPRWHARVSALFDRIEGRRGFSRLMLCLGARRLVSKLA
jgi:hypothetical protein